MKTYFGKDTPRFADIANNVSLVIANQNTIFNHQAKVPTVLYVEMLHVKETKPLPEVYYFYINQKRFACRLFSAQKIRVDQTKSYSEFNDRRKKSKNLIFFAVSLKLLRGNVEKSPFLYKYNPMYVQSKLKPI